MTDDDRETLLGESQQQMSTIRDALLAGVHARSPTAHLRREVTTQGNETFHGWKLIQDPGVLALEPDVPLRRPQPRVYPFDVLATSHLSVDTMYMDPYTSVGRGHSLWFCDPQEEGDFGWFEVAFTWTEPRDESGRVEFEPRWSMPDSPGALAALGPGTDFYRVAWPFTRVVPGDLDAFIARWAAWFVQASAGELRSNRVPEPSSEGSWRRE